MTSLNNKPEEPPPHSDSSHPTQLDGRIPPPVHRRADVPRGPAVHGSAGGVLPAGGDERAGDRDENQGQSALHPSFRADSVAACLGKQIISGLISLLGCLVFKVCSTADIHFLNCRVTFGIGRHNERGASFIRAFLTWLLSLGSREI